MTNTGSQGLGLALKALRTAADLTIEQVADMAGISPSYLSRAERGHITPSATWVQVVAVAIGDHLAQKAAA
jgi:predicted transcriptional regulator